MMEAWEEVSKADSGAWAVQKFFVGTSMFYSVILTRSRPVRNVCGCDFEKAPVELTYLDALQRRGRRGRGQCFPLTSSLFFLSF